MEWAATMLFRKASSARLKKNAGFPPTTSWSSVQVALIGAFLITYERGAEMLNFGAFIAFMGVNAAAFVHYYLRSSEKKNRQSPDAAHRFRGLRRNLVELESSREKLPAPSGWR